MKRITERRWDSIPEGEYSLDVTIMTGQAESDEEANIMEQDALLFIKKEWKVDLKRDNSEWFHDDRGNLVIAQKHYMNSKQAQIVLDDCYENVSEIEWLNEYPQIIVRFLRENGEFLKEEELI